MTVVRTIVFPALRLLVWAVIALALVVLAFRGTGGDAVGSGGPDAPTLELSSPAVPVARGTVTNTVSVTGTVAADAAVPVKATAAGTVRKVLVTAGARVAAGQPLLEIRYEEQLDPVVGRDSEGNPTATPRPPRVRTATVAAPVAGSVTVDVLVDQIVAVGDRAGAIAPGTLSVTASLTQVDQFRLLAPPATAEVQVQGGPAPFTCTGLAIGGPAATEDAPRDDGAGPPPGFGSGGGGTTARCAVPEGVAVFAGMGATVLIQAGSAENVLVVPITAVQGAVQQGNVWVVADDGAEEQRAVALGLTDGELVEVREGLAQGEQVLQFVPVPDDAVDDSMSGGPYG